MGDATTSLCRLTVLTSQMRADLAVPLETTVSSLMSMLVRTLGPQVADQGAESGGFVLQRSGAEPLDPSMTLRASQVRDGDVLHMRMRSARLPEVAYDDVLDAVSTGVLSKTARWAEEHTARVCLGAASLCIAFVLALCLVSGPSWIGPAAISGGLSLLLMGAAVGLDKAWQEPRAALTPATGAVIAAACSGAMIVGGDNSVLGFGGVQLLPAAGAAVLMSILGVVLLSRGVSGFVAVIGAGLITVVGAAVADFGSFDAVATAAFAAGISLLVSPVIPVAAFKLSRLPLPFVPSGSGDLRADRGVVEGTKVISQAARADQFLTGVVVALASVLAGSSVVMASGSASAQGLAGVLSVICLLRARLFTGRSQRMAMLVAAGVGGLATLAQISAGFDPLVRMLAIAVPVCLLAVLMVALVVVLPGRRYSPPSGQAADILEALLVLMILPLIVGVIGLYSRIREMVG